MLERAPDTPSMAALHSSRRTKVLPSTMRLALNAVSGAREPARPRWKVGL